MNKEASTNKNESYVYCCFIQRCKAGRDLGGAGIIFLADGARIFMAELDPESEFLLQALALTPLWISPQN